MTRTATRDRLRNEWNLTDPATDPRTFEQYVADETAAEAAFVGAFFIDPRDITVIDRCARHGGTVAAR